MREPATEPALMSQDLDLGLTAAYDYELPAALIATVPAGARAESRLLVMPARDALVHTRFSDLPRFLRAGDLLVRNTARVLPARLVGAKPTGGRVELLVLAPVEGDRAWDDARPVRFRALGRSSRPLRPGTRVALDEGHAVEVTGAEPDGTLTLETDGRVCLRRLVEAVGATPLPPYIRRSRVERGERVDPEIDRERYQTVYAGQPGAVAAPTAGLHFDVSIFGQLAELGVEVADLRLDVGVGTFRPLSAARLEAHRMHAERYFVPEHTAALIAAALAEGRRVIAVGTTVLRALEDQALRGLCPRAGEYETALFIHPGVPTRWVDALVTNFHLPRSSLLMLVCAMGGYDRVMSAYREAISRGYRFYSYGDATLVFKNGQGSP